MAGKVKGSYKKCTELTSDENKLVSGLIGDNKCLITVVAQVYETEPPVYLSWIKIGTGALCIIEDISSRSLYFQLYCIDEGKLIWEQAASQIECYTYETKFFHMFEENDYFYGFNFATKTAAKRFRKCHSKLFKFQQSKTPKKKYKTCLPSDIGNPTDFAHLLHVEPVKKNIFENDEMEKQIAKLLEIAGLRFEITEPTDNFVPTDDSNDSALVTGGDEVFRIVKVGDVKTEEDINDRMKDFFEGVIKMSEPDSTLESRIYENLLISPYAVLPNNRISFIVTEKKFDNNSFDDSSFSDMEEQNDVDNITSHTNFNGFKKSYELILNSDDQDHFSPGLQIGGNDVIHAKDLNGLVFTGPRANDVNMEVNSDAPQNLLSENYEAIHFSQSGHAEDQEKMSSIDNGVYRNIQKPRSETHGREEFDRSDIAGYQDKVVFNAVENYVNDNFIEGEIITFNGSINNGINSKVAFDTGKTGEVTFDEEDYAEISNFDKPSERKACSARTNEAEYDFLHNMAWEAAANSIKKPEKTSCGNFVSIAQIAASLSAAIGNRKSVVIPRKSIMSMFYGIGSNEWSTD